MNYEALETEIVERLNAKFNEYGTASGMVAIMLPETEAQFTQEIEKSRATVAYYGSTWQGPASVNAVSQEETLTIRVLLEARKLRGPNGIYAFGNLIKKILTGYRPQGAERLYPVKYDLDSGEHNNYMPYLDFECRSIAVQNLPEDEVLIGTGLKKVSVGGQQTEVIELK